MKIFEDNEKQQSEKKKSRIDLPKRLIRFTFFLSFAFFVFSLFLFAFTPLLQKNHDTLLFLSSLNNVTNAFLTIFTFFIPTRISNIPAIPGTLNDDGNSILNKDLDPEIFHYIGAYSPRYTVKQDSSIPPLGCTIEVVNSLERHGARYMTTGALKEAQKTLDRIQKALKDSENISSDLEFLKNYKLQNGTNDLIPFGALQAWYSGRSTASVYPLLTRFPPFVRATGDEETLDDRVILTAKYWRLGFDGKDFPSGMLTNGDDVRAASVKFIEPSVIFSELPGFNNTLDVDTCTKANEIPDSEGEKGAQMKFASTTILPTIGKDLQKRLIKSGAKKSFNLTGKDIINLAELCSFDTLGRATVEDGKLLVKQSPFCGLFNATEWPTLGYALDVGKWKGAGYGNPYYEALGQGFLRELIARFTDKLPSLEQPTSLNTTIDGNSTNFPLPSQLKGPLIYFDGSHDNQIGPIVAAANLFNGPKLGTDSNAQNEPHNWIFSQIAPFQGKIVIEKLSCLPLAKKYIRIRANGAILDSNSYCNPREDKRHIDDTLCPLETFISNLEFVQSDKEWNKCYS